MLTWKESTVGHVLLKMLPLIDSPLKEEIAFKCYSCATWCKFVFKVSIDFAVKEARQEDSA